MTEFLRSFVLCNFFHKTGTHHIEILKTNISALGYFDILAIFSNFDFLKQNSHL